MATLLLFMGIDYGQHNSSYHRTTNYMACNPADNRNRLRLTITVTSALLFLWFLYALTIMGFRGDFSADYNSYVMWFHRIRNMSEGVFWENFSFENIFSRYLETGYAVLNRIVGHFTENHVWLFVASAFIICFPVFKLIRNQEQPWIAALLWISIGPYLESFNTMRGAMAASILVFSLKYMRERKLIKYLLIVLLATMFHSVAILMVFAYFLPLIKPSKKSIIIMALIASAVSASGEVLTVKFNNIFHIAYDDTRALTLLYRYKSSGLSLVVLLIIEIIALYMFFKAVKSKAIDIKNPYIRMVFNGNLIWVFFKIMQIFTGYSTRFAMLFFYYPCIFIPMLVFKRKEEKSLSYLIVGLSIIWFIVNTFLRYPNYYFAK